MTSLLPAWCRRIGPYRWILGCTVFLSIFLANDKHVFQLETTQIIHDLKLGFRSVADFIWKGRKLFQGESCGDDHNDSDPFRIKGTCLNSNWGSFDEFYDVFDCDDIIGKDAPLRPIYNESTWTMLRGAYQAIVGPENSTLPSPTMMYGDGFHVPVKVEYASEMGRGVFAKSFIRNGTKIWDTKFTARFTQGQQYRKFMLSIPPELVCETMIWCYGFKLDGQPLACCDLDDGTLVNTADNEADVNLVVQHNSLPNFAFHAKRDIQVGEQLLSNYSEFAFEEAWAELGLPYDLSTDYHH